MQPKKPRPDDSVCGKRAGKGRRKERKGMRTCAKHKGDATDGQGEGSGAGRERKVSFQHVKKTGREKRVEIGKEGGREEEGKRFLSGGRTLRNAKRPAENRTLSGKKL